MDGNDIVVRTIDVFVTQRLEDGGLLYLLQSPLRPPTRPYDVEYSEDVRFKPQQGRLEIELPLDMSTDTYDTDAAPALQISKVALRSAPVPLRAGTLAVGIMQDGAFHLVPMTGALQLRPSLGHLDVADDSNRETAGRNKSSDYIDDMDDDGMEPPTLQPLQVQVKRRETEKQVEARLTSHAFLKMREDEEAWISLTAAPRSSQAALSARARLSSAPSTPAAGPVEAADYLSSLIPSRAPPQSMKDDEGATAGALSRTYLETLTLSERLNYVFGKGQRQVLRYEKVRRLAPPGTPIPELLAAIEESAVLVQGCWVSKSSLVCSGDPGRATARDWLLYLLHNNREIWQADLQKAKGHLGLPSEDVLKELLRDLTVLRTGSADGSEASWEFRELADESFIEANPELAARHAAFWEPFAKIASAAPGAARVVVPTQRVAYLEPAKAKQVGLILEPFVGNKRILSIEAVRQFLRSHPSAAGVREQAEAEDAVLVQVMGPAWEAVAGRLVQRITGDANLDPFRSVVVKLLVARRTATLRKSDVMEASTAALGAVPNGLYTRVMKDLCEWKSGAWELKSGLD